MKSFFRIQDLKLNLKNSKEKNYFNFIYILSLEWFIQKKKLIRVYLEKNEIKQNFNFLFQFNFYEK